MLKFRLFAKENIGGIFHLHQAPVIGRLESLMDRAVLLCLLVKVPMEDTDVGVFVKFMGTLRVFDAGAV